MDECNCTKKSAALGNEKARMKRALSDDAKLDRIARSAAEREADIEAEDADREMGLDRPWKD